MSCRPIVLLPWLLACACSKSSPGDTAPADTAPGDTAAEEVPETCTYVESRWGDAGTEDFEVEVVAQGLATPWGLDFLPSGAMLLTERDGRVSVISEGVVTPVGEVDVSRSGEGGLLGLAISPDFDSSRAFFVYGTFDGPAGDVNQVQRWTLSEDEGEATFDEVVVDSIPAQRYHDGGRIRIGPDDKLYVGTGDAGRPDRAQEVGSLAGKLLRLELDGSVPADNPFPGEAALLLGIRNTQGFDWLDDGRLVVTDHGPSGLSNEDGRSDHDEVTLASAGDNLGWPEIYACEEGEGYRTPAITWADAMPPGGAAIYRGSAIEGWQGDLLIGVLGFSSDTHQLHRLRLDAHGNVAESEVYLAGDEGYGRLREVVMGPDGHLYVTTSNCDGRGDCGDGDLVLRLVGPAR